jgi:hypothetical protein
MLRASLQVSIQVLLHVSMDNCCLLLGSILFLDTRWQSLLNGLKCNLYKVACTVQPALERQVEKQNSPQASSSEESPQWSMPSHFQLSMTHTLFWHCHCPGRQWLWGQCALSDPSSQSWWTSQSSQASRHRGFPGHWTFWSGHAGDLSER